MKHKIFYDSSNEILGWRSGNKIFLRRNSINPNTTVHEYTHIGAEAIKSWNPQLGDWIKELIKGTAVYDDVAKMSEESLMAHRPIRISQS